MKIDDLDGRIRGFEAVLDPTVLPGVFMVARLDGRNFTRLTKELHFPQLQAFGRGLVGVPVTPTNWRD